MLCGEGSLVNTGLDGVRAISLKCRSWLCEDCRHDRKRQLMGMAMSGHPNSFITLTVDPSRFQTPLNRARELVIAWRRIVELAKAKYGYAKIPYLCVFEATKKGEPHLHILARVEWISQKWLADQMEGMTGARVCWIERIKSKKKAAAYVSKYVGKAPHKFGTCKRYWQTRDYEDGKWEKPEKEEGWSNNWRIVDKHIDDLLEEWQTTGYEIAVTRYMLFGLNWTRPERMWYEIEHQEN